MDGIITLPPSLKELYALFSNPAVMIVAISLVLESTAFIQDSTVANWKKLLAVLVAAVSWTAAVAGLGLLLDPTSFTLSWGSLYGILVAGVAAAGSMAVFNKLYSDLPEPIQKFFLLLFGKRVISG